VRTGEVTGNASNNGGSEGGAQASEGSMDSLPSAAGDAQSQADTANGGAGAGTGQAARKIMAPVDAAIEILRGQPPGRGVHVRQIADSAIRRRLIHGEPNEAWRVIRTSLAAEPKDRLRNGMRPRVRSAGAGLYALARRTPDADLEKAEQVFGDARRALRERTIGAIEKRITDLPAGAFEALARVLLQREGFGPTTFVKRVEGTIYVEALRGRGTRPSKCLIALRPGGSAAGRRAIGELRAGIRARNQDEGLLMLGGRLAEDAISEWKQPGCPLEIADGSAMAETCARHGVGVVSATVNVDFVDADFFAELAEG
ncbi:MAG: restriction endonuclease, partial [Deltaproteobacteria bacterium]|nr:restriction endonuclease [Deltaproteobacteria bacterium]